MNPTSKSLTATDLFMKFEGCSLSPLGKNPGIIRANSSYTAICCGVTPPTC